MGSAAEPMSTDMIETLFTKRLRNSIGKIKSPNQQLVFEQLHIYYNSVGKTLNSQFAKNLELLNEDNDYNYVAYLMSDTNGISLKAARYNGRDRIDLIESNEYGYCSLIKATKQVLEKIELENRTLTKITSKEREERRIWNSIALREAVVNAIVHNDYTREVAPKFEFFDDRFEITSYGGLPEGLTQNEFFDGLSIPRNKEIMRIFKDLDLVEQLGSGIPRILQSYEKSCFHFSENYVRMTFPSIENISQELNENTESVEENVNLGKSVEENVNLEESVEKSVEKILYLLKINPHITQKELISMVGLSRRGVEKNISILKAKKIIKRIGPNKGGYWKVNDI
jgi:predicted HTH transcriptional regulator